MDVKTILLVVADAARRAALGDALRLEAHSVLVAEDAYEALALAGSSGRPPDLIVTDQRLEKGAGPALVSTVERRRPGARVLFLAGFRAVTVHLPIYYLDPNVSPSAVARVASRLVAAR